MNKLNRSGFDLLTHFLIYRHKIFRHALPSDTQLWEWARKIDDNRTLEVPARLSRTGVAATIQFPDGCFIKEEQREDALR